VELIDIAVLVASGKQRPDGGELVQTKSAIRFEASLILPARGEREFLKAIDRQVEAKRIESPALGMYRLSAAGRRDLKALRRDLDELSFKIMVLP
jgi:hypothetical protein